MNLIKETSAATFELDVLNSDNPVLVHFGKTSSAPCRQIAPLLQDVAQKYQGDLSVVRLDVDAEAPLAAKYGIKAVPTLIFFKYGANVDQLVGAPTSATLQHFIDANL